jgi:hypothetical protein
VALILLISLPMSFSCISKPAQTTITEIKTLTSTSNVTTTVSAVVTTTHTSIMPASTNVIETTATVSVTTTVTSVVTMTNTNAVTTSISTSEPHIKDGVLTENAAPAGITLEFLLAPRPYGQYGTGNFSLYYASLNLLDVLRGEDALKYLSKETNYAPYLNQPAADLEYICARFKFEYRARDPRDNQSYRLKQGEFLIYSEEKIMYENVPFILPWKSDIQNYDIFPGDAIEIMIVSLVGKNDTSPLMYYTSGSIWFALY